MLNMTISLRTSDNLRSLFIHWKPLAWFHCVMAPLVFALLISHEHLGGVMLILPLFIAAFGLSMIAVEHLLIMAKKMNFLRYARTSALASISSNYLLISILFILCYRIADPLGFFLILLTTPLIFPFMTSIVFVLFSTTSKLIAES